MWELWMLQQNSKEKTWAAPLWRSIHIYQKGSLPQAHPVRYPPSGSSSPSYTRRNPCHNHFYLYTKFRSRLIRGLNGQILIKGDFNGHSYSWGNLSNDTRGDVIERFTEKRVCASSTMDPPHTWNHKPSIHRTQHQPLTSPSVHLAWLLNVHGRSFLTPMVVITIQSSYPCLLLLETRTRMVILATGCSQGLTGTNLQSCAWTRSQVISSMTKTPSPHSSRTSSMLQKTASQGQPHAVPPKSNLWFDEECREMLKTRRALDRKVHRGGGARVETLISSRQTQAQARRLFTQKKRSHGPGMCHNWTPTPQSSMCGTEWGKYPVKMSAHPSNISMGRMVLPSLTPRISLMRKQQHSQTTPPLPTTVPDSRPSRLKMRELESTSPMITLKSTTSPSDWEISGVLSWRPNPVPLGLTGSKTTCWNTSLRTH